MVDAYEYVQLADEGTQRKRRRKINRLRQMVKSLREEAGPTMSVGAGGYTGAADARASCRV